MVVAYSHGRRSLEQLSQQCGGGSFYSALIGFGLGPAQPRPVAQTQLLHTKSTDQEKSGVQPSAPVAHCNMTGDYDGPNLDAVDRGTGTKVGAGPYPY
jgi:hypothetical protein